MYDREKFERKWIKKLPTIKPYYQIVENHTRRPVILPNQRPFRPGGKICASIRKVIEILPGRPENDALADLKDALDSVKSLVSGHLPEFYGNRSVNVEQIFSAPVFERILNQCREVLGKLPEEKGSGEIVVVLRATKSLYDAYYDALGQCCICGYGFELERNDFQPIRLEDRETGGQLGVVYVLKGRVKGRDALILAGVEPRKSFLNRIDAAEFVEKLGKSLHEVAAANGCDGGVFTNAGWRTGDGFRDDGRTAQRPTVRRALLALADTDHPVELPPGEEIEFPAKYDRPIRYLAALPGLTNPEIPVVKTG